MMKVDALEVINHTLFYLLEQRDYAKETRDVEREVALIDAGTLLTRSSRRLRSEVEKNHDG